MAPATMSISKLIGMAHRYRLPEVASGVGIVAWAVFLMLEQGTTTALYFACGQAFVWLHLLATPHELGHAVAAWLVGARVRSIHIGTGRRLLDFDLGRTEVRVHLWLGGHSLVDDVIATRRSYRLRSFVIALGGPLVNLVLAGAAWLLGGRTLFPGEGVAAWQAFLVANLGVAFVSLWPWTLYEGDEPYPSDGLQLLTIPRMTDEDIAAEIGAAGD